MGGHAAITLDIGTLSVVATCVTSLLGLLLLFVWSQDRVRALAWWGTAYLAGGLSVVVWSVEDAITPPLPAGIAIALLFFACGMMWNAARLMHGRPILWGGMSAGAAIWLLASLFPEFVQWGAGRIVLGCLTVSTYAFLTAAELRRERRRARFGRVSGARTYEVAALDARFARQRGERRKMLIRQWPALFAPALHGAVFLLPLPLAFLVPAERGVVSLASGWIAVFLIEAMLYVVGTAFVVLVLAKEEAARTHKTAASTDELTGLLNRRGVLAAAQRLIERSADRQEPVSVLMFDLDHFKSINDRFGHRVGDETLRLFAAVATAQLRASDLIGRFGGEEFLAILPGTLAETEIAAERVRLAFQVAARTVAGCDVGGTISIGAACGGSNADMTSLLIRSDAALYRAKAAGRNRLEIAREDIPTIFTTAPSAGRVEGPPAYARESALAA